MAFAAGPSGVCVRFRPPAASRRRRRQPERRIHASIIRNGSPESPAATAAAHRRAVPSNHTKERELNVHIG